MKLFEPGKIGKLRIKNRIVMSGMGCGGLAQPDGNLSQRGMDYFIARAKGGAGLITTGSCKITRDFEYDPRKPSLMVDNKAYGRWVEELAEGVHDYGAKLSVQLMAGHGRTGPREAIRRVRPVGPSAVHCVSDPNILSREMTVEEIERLLNAFASAAEVLKSAKVDAVELNCHGGYLVDQFLSVLWNKRTDAYGGDLEGRLKFLLEVISRLKNVLGKDFPVIVKYALTHYFEGGREIEEGIEIARRLEEAGVDALTIDAGCNETYYWVIPSQFQPPGCAVNLAAMVKSAVRIPLITVGKLGSPELAEEILMEGKADFIALGRALLADPEWPNKAKEGRLQDIRPCVGCFEGCSQRAHESKAISCTVNPATGYERELVVSPAENRKSVLVIGGGPGGMEAARVAAARGHRVSLWEKEPSLGGNLIPAAAPEFKESYRRLRDYLVLQLKKAGVRVVLGKEATPELVGQMNPDVVVVATGSTAVMPNIVGVDRENVVTATDLLSGKKESGESVIVIGGGVMGCETALHLVQKEKKVSIVEILSAVARDMYMANRMHLLRLLSEAGVKVMTETRVTKITKAGIVIIDKDGHQEDLKADTIVLAVGLKPKADLIDSLTEQAPEVYLIGDCSEPRKVIQAIREGFRLARCI